MKRTTLLALALGLPHALSQAADASAITNGVFAVHPSKALHVTYKGKVLIEKDEINYLTDFDAAELPLTRTTGDATVLNVVQTSHDTVQFRKEVALHKDGHLELTVKMRLFPYKNTPDKKSIAYSFMIPAQALDRATYTARVDRASRAKTVKGAFSADARDGSLTAAKCRFIAFETEQLKLVVDCNPYGVTSLQDYCMYGDPVGSWSVAKQGNYVVFSFGSTARSHGGIFCSKVLLYEGTYDYDKKHPYKKWTYRGVTPAMAQFTFGTAADTKGFDKADCLPYSPVRGWGWKDAAGLQTVRSESPDVIDNCVAAADGAARTFLLDVTPGQYLATIRVGHNTQAIGPFSVSLNGECLAKDVRVPAGHTKTLLLSTYVRRPDGQLKVRLEGPGPWAIRSLVVQAVIYQNEDYTFDRGLWLVDGLFSPQIEPKW